MGSSIFVQACKFLAVARGILVPWPGIEPGPSALGPWHLSHWATREVPHCTANYFLPCYPTAHMGDANFRRQPPFQGERKSLLKPGISENNRVQTSANLRAANLRQPAAWLGGAGAFCSHTSVALPVTSKKHYFQSHESTKTLSGNITIIQQVTDTIPRTVYLSSLEKNIE